MNRSPDESLAIVVALTDPALPHLGEALARFAEEAGPFGKVLVVDASGGLEGAELAERFANVRVIPRPVCRLAPSLWRDGLLATDADLVAFTTAQMVPGPGWIDALKARMRETGAAGVGGPIEPGPGLGATDKAVALLRYANYFPTSSPLPPGEGPGVRGLASPMARDHISCRAGLAMPMTHDSQGQPCPTGRPSLLKRHRRSDDPHPRPLSRGERGDRREASRIDPPGDNALYRRDRLMAIETNWLDGFWEVEVHKALRDRGESLAMAHQAVVSFVGGVGLASMAAQRFRHARHYGVGRSTGLTIMARLARAATAPLVPPLLCLRIARALRVRRMALAPWLPALLPLVGLAWCWAIGEAVGTLFEDRRLEPMTQPFQEVA
jgi:hypothetical protein